jgi:hypothetical protein
VRVCARVCLYVCCLRGGCVCMCVCVAVGMTMTTRRLECGAAVCVRCCCLLPARAIFCASMLCVSCVAVQSVLVAGADGVRWPWMIARKCRGVVVVCCFPASDHGNVSSPRPQPCLRDDDVNVAASVTACGCERRCCRRRPRSRP